MGVVVILFLIPENQTVPTLFLLIVVNEHLNKFLLETGMEVKPEQRLGHHWPCTKEYLPCDLILSLVSFAYRVSQQTGKNK